LRAEAAQIIFIVEFAETERFSKIRKAVLQTVFLPISYRSHRHPVFARGMGVAVKFYFNIFGIREIRDGAILS
jgi:hypothetical protein